MGANRTLWNEYRATWETFSRRLDELQALVAAGDRKAAENALLQVEKARLAHNTARDRVAEQLSEEVASRDLKDIIDVKDMKESERRRVRQTAQLLWELAGKPAGTAESDWHRAESLVRAASAG